LKRISPATYLVASETATLSRNWRTLEYKKKAHAPMRMSLFMELAAD